MTQMYIYIYMYILMSGVVGYIQLISQISISNSIMLIYASIHQAGVFTYMYIYIHLMHA